MSRPAIPPDAALSVGGRVDAQVAATLAEARRIRDTWREALADAVQAEVRRQMTGHLAQLAAWRAEVERDAVDLAVALAERRPPEPSPAELARWLDAAPGEVELAVCPADAERWRDVAPEGVTVTPSDGLRGGEFIVRDALGRRDGRWRTWLEGLLPR